MTASNERPSMATGRVINNISISPEHFRLTLRLPSSFDTPRPGQFVMIKDPERYEPLLPRPLSVYGFQRDSDEVIMDLLYRVAGRGTLLLSKIQPGASLTVLGPLGQGFTLNNCQNVILLAGGVGVAPLTYLLHEGYLRDSSVQNSRITCYVGAKTAELLVGIECLKGLCNLMIATDDGSAGHHGLVTDHLKCDLEGYDSKETIIYACGPTPMIRSLARIVMKTTIRCEVSLEERMACGIGACLGCSVAVREEREGSGYRRVCHDGPVFDIRQLLLKDSLGD